MKDYVTINHLRDIGFDFSDASTISKINTIENLPRHLDKPPKQIVLKSECNLGNCSVMETFLSYYLEISGNTPQGELRLDLPKESKQLEKVPYATIKSLLYLCTHKDEALAESASKIFRAIVLCDYEHVTDDVLYEIIKSYKQSGYYEKELINAISKSAFHNSDTLLHWRMVSACGGWYANAVKAGEQYIADRPDLTAAQLEKELSAAYKEAIKDKEWMSLLVKKIPTKQLIGMMWILYPDDRSVIEPSGSSGFMDLSYRTRTVRSLSLRHIVESYIWEALQRKETVSVDECIADEVMTCTASYYCEKTGCFLQDAMSEISAGEHCLLRGESGRSTLHISKECDTYVCKWR